MPDYRCAKCDKPFHRRGTKSAKYCSRPCQSSDRAPAEFVWSKWYNANRSSVIERAREWALNNPQKRRASKAKWQAKNRERLAADVRLRRAGNEASAVELVAILEAANGRCTYCGARSARLELDHVDAVSRGGSASTDNLLPACRSCNASKSNKDAADWIFERFGVEGLARAIAMLEQRKCVEALYLGTKITEVRA